MLRETSNSVMKQSNKQMMYITLSLCHFRISFHYSVDAFSPFADIINDLKLKEQCVYQRCK